MQKSLFTSPDELWEYTSPKRQRGPRNKSEWEAIQGQGEQTSIFDDSEEVLAGFDRRCNICTLVFYQDTIAVDKVPYQGWYICDRCELSIEEAHKLIQEGDGRGYGLLEKYRGEIADNARNNRLGYGVEVVPLDELLTEEAI